ncbi:MAG: GGDEF domain-containing protein [Candidatus Moranbacteria bacterium]|jgi:diguanylate cyclase (GGDEF)-like protein|nr:GGDEF domain-containing protein [Candidatus Moranbacteria bacterium]MBP9801819.1 GGDEF domain-containing protein [Candidatus Moranbacteria bacterium]
MKMNAIRLDQYILRILFICIIIGLIFLTTGGHQHITFITLAWMFMPLLQIFKDHLLVTDLQRKIKEQAAELSLLQEKITIAERDAQSDKLTGLLNLRGGLVAAERAFNAEKRRTYDADKMDAKTPPVQVAVAFIDLDGFKSVNDTLGHDTGDLVLRLASELLRRLFARATDIVYRKGGDEFVVIVFGKDASETTSHLEEFRRTFSVEFKKCFPQAVSPVTVSCGMVVRSILPSNTESLTTVLQNVVGAADMLMYRAKKEGKDRVIIVD